MSGFTEEVKKFFTNLTNRAGSAGFGWNVTSTPDAGSSAQVGSLTETAPATDTASSGLNGRLQRIAQGLTTIITGGVLTKQDIGRVSISLYAVGAAPGASTVEALVTLNIASGVAAVTTGTQYVIPAGKTLRILFKNFSSTGNSVATLAAMTFNMRVSAAGTITTASTPVIWSASLNTPAVSNAFAQISSNTQQGVDIVGDGTLSIGISLNATYVVNAPSAGVEIEGFLFTT